MDKPQLNLKQYIIKKVEQNSINIRPVFRKFDDDKSGYLNYDEFRQGLLHMGIPLNDREFGLLCKEVDNDGSGDMLSRAAGRPQPSGSRPTRHS